MAKGPVVIGFDGSPAAQHAIEKSAELLAPNAALVVAVWEPGTAWEYAELPADVMPATPVDVQLAVDLDKALRDGAEQTARRGASLAQHAGFEAKGLAVADERNVAQTLLRVAREHSASAIVVGSRGHRRVAELVLGSTTHALIREADCPVVVVRASEDKG
ncbi:MAG: universal stress protein [Thermoleophilaceae bacterium]